MQECGTEVGNVFRWARTALATSQLTSKWLHPRKTVRTTKWNWNETVKRLFRNCFVSVSFRCENSLTCLVYFGPPTLGSGLFMHKPITDCIVNYLATAWLHIFYTFFKLLFLKRFCSVFHTFLCTTCTILL